MKEKKTSLSSSFGPTLVIDVSRWIPTCGGHCCVGSDGCMSCSSGGVLTKGERISVNSWPFFMFKGVFESFLLLEYYSVVYIASFCGIEVFKHVKKCLNWP